MEQINYTDLEYLSFSFDGSKKVKSKIKFVDNQTIYFPGLLSFNVLRHVRHYYTDVFTIQLPFSNYLIFVKKYEKWIPEKNLNFAKIIFLNKKYIITSRRTFKNKTGRPKKLDTNIISQILHLKSLGHSVRQISALLNVPKSTVHTYLTSLSTFDSAYSLYTKKKIS